MEGAARGSSGGRASVTPRWRLGCCFAVSAATLGLARLLPLASLVSTVEVGQSGEYAAHFATGSGDAWHSAAPSRPGPSLADSKPAAGGSDRRGVPQARSGQTCRPLPEGRSPPQVAAVIAVHPPKFYDLAMVLEEYLSCPAAVAAMSVVVVFSNSGDLELFRSCTRAFSPGVVEGMGGAWTAISADPLPDFLAKMTGGAADEVPRNQKTSAFKKWFGVCHLLDGLPHGPAYALMLDADVRFFNASDCGFEGRWSRLLGRVREMEASREWLGTSLADVEVLDSGLLKNDSVKVSGDNGLRRRMLKANADWVTGGPSQLIQYGGTPRASKVGQCGSRECDLLRWQVNRVFFTWWTDLPFVNLGVASRLLQFVGGGAGAMERAGCSFRELSRRLQVVTPFEHFAYQQWSVLHEGFVWRDVSAVVGPGSVWGSYSEGPLPSARLAELRPAWVSAASVALSLRGEVRDLASAEPLLIFHTDHASGKGAVKPVRSEIARRKADPKDCVAPAKRDSPR